VDLGPQVVLELPPGAGGGGGLPVDPAGVAGEGEPEDSDGIDGGLAKAVRAADGQASPDTELPEDLGLVDGEPLPGRPGDRLLGESDRIVQPAHGSKRRVRERPKRELAEVPQSLQAHLEISGRGMAGPTTCVAVLVGDLL
jgi:hypothetical protein